MRFNFDIPANFMVVVSWGLLFLLPAHAVACRIAGLYRGIWMFASLPDLRRVLRAVALSAAALLVFLRCIASKIKWSHDPCWCFIPC